MSAGPTFCGCSTRSNLRLIKMVSLMTVWTNDVHDSFSPAAVSHPSRLFARDMVLSWFDLGDISNSWASWSRFSLRGAIDFFFATCMHQSKNGVKEQGAIGVIRRKEMGRGIKKR